jgi:hypothetical protein
VVYFKEGGYEGLFSEKYIKDEGENDTYHNRSDPGEVEDEIIFFYINITGEFGEASFAEEHVDATDDDENDAH